MLLLSLFSSGFTFFIRFSRSFTVIVSPVLHSMTASAMTAAGDERRILVDRVRASTACVRQLTACVRAKRELTSRSRLFEDRER